MVDKKCMEWETYSFITLIKRRDNYNDKKEQTLQMLAFQMEADIFFKKRI